MIQGLGIDLVDVARLERAIAAHGDRFLDRVFTANELRHAARFAGRARSIHLAGRFAAKEAAVKALGTGIGRGVGFHDVEVRASETTSAIGGPTLVLHGAALERAGGAGRAHVHLSITHTDTHAAAVVALEREDGTPV